MNLQRHFKKAKNSKKRQKWPSTLSLIAPTILELEKSLSNKSFCSNIKLFFLLLI